MKLAVEKKGVATRHPQYETYEPLWQRADDAAEGQHAMHKAGIRYLPKLADETDTAYKARLGRSEYFNATWRTISGLTGMAFNRAPAVDLPGGFDPYIKDINLAGVSLDDFARDLVEEVLEYGRVGLLVDFPTISDKVVGITVADSERLGRRPKIVTYCAEHCINWRFGRVANREALTLVVLTEESPVNADEFSHETETQYRVLDLVDGKYRQRLFRKNERNEDEQIGPDIYPVMNGKPMDFIPFCFVGAGGKADTIDTPPLCDLVDANIAHYQVNSDYRHGLHFTGLPTPVISGYQPESASEKFYIGSLSAWVFPDPNAKAAFLEFTGQGLEALRLALVDLEKRMAVLGARMLADQAQQARTATEAAIEVNGENSILASIVIAVSGAMEWALGVFAQWCGMSGNVIYQINREFLPAGMTFQMLTAQVGAWQAGAISDEDLFRNLQSGDIIAGDKTLEEHQEQVKAAPAAMPRPALQPGDEGQQAA